MSYIPNPNDPSNPLDTVDISTAAAEFRALKTFMSGITTVASAATPDIFNAATEKISYTGTVTATGFAPSLVAGENERTLFCVAAAAFTAGANLLIDGITSGATLTVAAGTVLKVFAITTTQFRIVQVSPIPAYNVSGTVASATTAITATTATNVTNALGQGQTLQLIGGRSAGTPYTNTTSLPIWVMVSGVTTVGNTAQLIDNTLSATVDAITNNGTGSINSTVKGIILAGHSYQVNFTPTNWYEIK